MTGIDLFQGNADPMIDEQKDYYVELVGPDKKYKDNTAAGRALVEKDLFIEQLKRENASFKQAYETLESQQAGEKRLEDLVEKLVQKTPASNVEQQVQQERREENKVPSPEDIAKLVEQSITLSEKRKTAEQNANEVVRFLTEKYGANYPAKLRQLASQLNYSSESFNRLATESPTAFKKLIESVDSSAPSGFRAPPASNISGFVPSSQSDEPKTYEDAVATLKRQFPTEFRGNAPWTPNTRNKLYALAQKYGAGFYDKR